MQGIFGIGYPLQAIYGRQPQLTGVAPVSCCALDGSFINQKPSLLHPNRNDADKNETYILDFAKAFVYTA